jgi:transposase
MMSYDTLIAETAPDPIIMLANKGNDNDAIRADFILRGADAIIPIRSKLKIQIAVDKNKYAMRNLVDRFFNKLKHSRRVATHYDKLAFSFIGFVQLATIRIWIRFVHKT